MSAIGLPLPAIDLPAIRWMLPALLMITLRCCACDTSGNVIDDDLDGYYHPDSEGACFYFMTDPDCDDDDPSIHPGADDEEGDGIDQNCDGVDGVAEGGPDMSM